MHVSESLKRLLIPMTQELFKCVVFLLLAKWLVQMKALTSCLLRHGLVRYEAKFRTHKMRVNLNSHPIWQNMAWNRMLDLAKEKYGISQSPRTGHE